MPIFAGWTSRAAATDLDATTRLQLFKVAQKNGIATLCVQFVAAGAVLLASSPDVRPQYAMWLGVLLAVGVGRLVVDRLLARSIRLDPTRLPRHLPALHAAGLVITAGLWAVLACWRFPQDSIGERYMVALVLSALSGGAIGILAPLKWTGRAYVSLMLLPACVTLLLTGGDGTLLGIVGIVFWMVMLAGHANNHAIVVSSIRMSEKNIELAALIARQNQQLEERVSQRTRELEVMTRKAEAANLAKSQFLATISHEIRTPLNAISGSTQLLGTMVTCPEQLEKVKVLGSSTRMLRALVDDVLDVSRIEAGSLTLQAEAFDLAELVGDISALYDQTAREKGLELNLDLDPDCHPHRMGDRVRVMQIICNLLSNAVKMTEEGAVRLRITGSASSVYITVADTGPGIPLKDQAKIFDRFVQIDGTSTRVVGGAGLGLSICRDLARMMGGDIQLRSGEGTGATFRVTLPLPVVERPAVSAAAEPVEPPEAARVLIVDDNAVNRKILKALLDHLGVSSVTVEDGRQAVDAWRTEHWDAILMDVHMPVMDGIEATRAIRALELGGARGKTPIIAVTASVLAHEAERYVEAGMDAMIPKPIDLTYLAESLNAQLGAENQAA